MADLSELAEQEPHEPEGEVGDEVLHATLEFLPSPTSPRPLVPAALEEFIGQYEQAWLDESIPALSGATPRQVAADPSRREDLVRLLASFPAGGSGQMDPDRLRAASGL
jgi:hypothetical protein